MIKLEPYSSQNAREISSWICDEETLRKWSADTYSFPVAPEDINEFYRKQSEKANFFPFIAVLNGEIIGHMVFWVLEQNTVRFGFIVLNPEKRGQGLGKQMLSVAKENAQKEYAAKKISLGVFKNNPAAYQCYKSLGFCESSERQPKEFQFFGEAWTCLEMDLTL